MAKYRCRECRSVETATRSYRNHFGSRCRCPRCGTYRISKLKARDKIDKMETGFLNLIEKWLGGSLYHCRFCRIQFYDRRKYSPGLASGLSSTVQRPAAQKPAPSVTREPNTATLDGQTTLHPPTASVR